MSTAVLGASSEYFAKAFSTRFRDHQSTRFTDDDPETMACMIIFLYAGDYPCIESGLTISRVFDKRPSTTGRGRYELGWWRPLHADRSE
jgi:hypothetical protein